MLHHLLTCLRKHLDTCPWPAAHVLPLLALSSSLEIQACTYIYKYRFALPSMHRATAMQRFDVQLALRPGHAHNPTLAARLNGHPVHTRRCVEHSFCSMTATSHNLCCLPSAVP